MAGLWLAAPSVLLGQDPFPRVNAADLSLAQYLNRYTTQLPGVLTDVGSSWTRKVYERIDTEFCNAVGPLTIANCLNNPNSPEVRSANSDVRGAASSVAGEVISVAVETTPMTGVNRPTEGSASARGMSELGANRLEVRAAGGFAREVQFFNSTDPDQGLSTFTEFLSTGAGAQSAWWTRFTPDFTGSMTFGLSTFRHGADGGLDAGPGVSIKEATLRFGVHDLTQQQCYASTFEYNLNPSCPSWRGAAWVGGVQRDDLFAFGSSPFSLTIDVVAGRTYSMAMNLFLYVGNAGVLDFFGTSRLDFIEVPDGGALNFAAGSFTVRTAGSGGPGGDGPPASVPEPATLPLLAAGIAALALGAARRRSTISSQRN